MASPALLARHPLQTLRPTDRFHLQRRQILQAAGLSFPASWEPEMCAIMGRLNTMDDTLLLGPIRMPSVTI
jgi:hypothetical protein